MCHCLNNNFQAFIILDGLMTRLSTVHCHKIDPIIRFNYSNQPVFHRYTRGGWSHVTMSILVSSLIRTCLFFFEARVGCSTSGYICSFPSKISFQGTFSFVMTETGQPQVTGRQSRPGLKNTADSIMQDNAYNYRMSRSLIVMTSAMSLYLLIGPSLPVLQCT